MSFRCFSCCAHCLTVTLCHSWHTTTLGQSRTQNACWEKLPVWLQVMTGCHDNGYMHQKDRTDRLISIFILNKIMCEVGHMGQEWSQHNNTWASATASQTDSNMKSIWRVVMSSFVSSHLHCNTGWAFFFFFFFWHVVDGIYTDFWRGMATRLLPEGCMPTF